MSGQRIALIIGNSDYQASGHLPNPVNDAALLTRRFEALQYEIVGGASSALIATGHNAGENLTSMQMLKLLGDFIEKVKPGATAVVYYAGHGIQVSGKNFLVPVDDSLSRDLPNLGLIEIKPRLERLIEKVGPDGAVAVFLDACRDNPVSKQQQRQLLDLMTDEDKEPEWGQEDRQRSSATRGGLATIKLAHAAGGRTFIGFATAPGDVAYDGPKGSTNSPFAIALDKHLETRGLHIEALYDRVQCDVQDAVAAMNRHQDPWSETNLDRELQLHQRNGWPIVVLGGAGFLIGLVICLAIFSRSVLVDPMPLWAWPLGLLFGLAAAFGTWKWGSCKSARDITLAFFGPGVGFALALAIMQIVPSFPAETKSADATPAQLFAGWVYWAVTIFGGLLYLIGTFLVRSQKRLPWPKTPLGKLNLALTWLLPFIIVGVLLRLEYYMASANPVLLAYAMFALLGGVIYAGSIPLACRAQGGNFAQFGPFTGAVTVGLLMSGFFAIFSSITWRWGIPKTDANWLLVLLGALWHGLLGAQLGYCFTYYVPDHRRTRPGAN